MTRLLNKEYKEHLSKLESKIDALAKEVEDYNIVKSIRGIGEKIAVSSFFIGLNIINIF